MSDERCPTCGYMRNEETTCRCGKLKAQSSFAAPAGSLALNAIPRPAWHVGLKEWVLIADRQIGEHVMVMRYNGRSHFAAVDCLLNEPVSFQEFLNTLGAHPGSPIARQDCSGVAPPLPGATPPLSKLEEAITVLQAIAEMPEYDQDDAHRLRNMARQFLKQKQTDTTAHQR